MPIYEYEPLGHDCTMCPNRVQVLQGIGEEPLCFCPDCGLSVRRVVSRVSVQIASGNNASKAAKHGFTTWKKAGANTWEKVDGQGVDVIVGDPRDVQSVKEESKPQKVWDLDKTD